MHVIAAGLGLGSSTRVLYKTSVHSVQCYETILDLLCRLVELVTDFTLGGLRAHDLARF
jgi:hypothetical protein